MPDIALVIPELLERVGIADRTDIVSAGIDRTFQKLIGPLLNLEHQGAIRLDAILDQQAVGAIDGKNLVLPVFLKFPDCFEVVKNAGRRSNDDDLAAPDRLHGDFRQAQCSGMTDIVCSGNDQLGIPLVFVCDRLVVPRWVGGVQDPTNFGDAWNSIHKLSLENVHN